jgi:hypothetical protein
MDNKNAGIEKAIRELIPKLQQQIQLETRTQLENNLRALLKNPILIQSITQAQLKILQKAADTCKNQGPGTGTKMFASLWQKVLDILNSFMKKKDITDDEDEGRITEINHIIYNSLIHPTRNDLTNMDIFITRKGFGWKDDLDSIDNQLALLKLSSLTDKKLNRKLVNVNKQRITHKKRDDKPISEQNKKINEKKKEDKSNEDRKKLIETANMVEKLHEKNRISETERKKEEEERNKKEAKRKEDSEELSKKKKEFEKLKSNK